MLMKSVDKTLELLQDSQWHSLDDIRFQVSLSEDKFKKIISFLVKIDFISLDSYKSCVGIKPLGLKFLELPIK